MWYPDAERTPHPARVRRYISMARIVPVNAKGTRDFLPRDLVRRNRVFGLLRDTFERYGYEPLETPAVENTQGLEGKCGGEGDRLLFPMRRRGAAREVPL